MNLDVGNYYILWIHSSTGPKSLAIKRIQLVNTHRKITRSYVPYDPKLKIGGKEMPFIQQVPMKFLDGEIYKDLSDSEVRATVSAKFKDLLKKTNHDKVNNIVKLWIMRTM